MCEGGTMTAPADMDGGIRASLGRMSGWGTAALMLLAPLVAMRFTDEVAWDAFDFASMAALLGGVGLGVELAVRKTGNAAYRSAAAVALAATFLLVWINAAVGVIGSEQEDANLLYGGVLAVGLVGAVIVRFRPAGLARAMAATAFAQAAVPVIAPISGAASTALAWSPEALVLTSLFAAMWLLSAWLFRRAAI
jgi:hypothetical protein